MNPRSNEQGVALVVSLLVVLIVAAIGVAVAVSSRGGARVATAFKNQETAFATAVAGLERAREVIRSTRFNNSVTTTDFDSMLTARAAGGALVNSTSLASFGTTNGFTRDDGATTNVPISGPANLDSASYQVFLTNGGADAVTSTNDTDDTITMTSFGSAPNSVGFSAVQAVYRIDPAFIPPGLPALLTMPGPTVNLDLPNSNAQDMDGNNGGSPHTCYATIGVSTTTARTFVQNINKGPGSAQRDQNYHTCNPAGGADLIGMASVDNFISGADPYNDPPTNTPTLQAGDTRLTNVSYLTGLVTQLTAAADFTSTTQTGFTLGSVSSPKIVVISGDYTMSGNANGYGVLVVTGTLHMNGTPGYHGTIYVIGDGIVDRNGGGNGVINCGGLLIANTNTPWPANPALVGTPTYTHSGGGNSSFEADCPGGLTGTTARFAHPLQRVSFQQLR